MWSYNAWGGWRNNRFNYNDSTRAECLRGTSAQDRGVLELAAVGRPVRNLPRGGPAVHRQGGGAHGRPHAGAAGRATRAPRRRPAPHRARRKMRPTYFLGGRRGLAKAGP